MLIFFKLQNAVLKPAPSMDGHLPHHCYCWSFQNGWSCQNCWSCQNLVQVFPAKSQMHFHGSETAGLTDYKPPWPLVPLAFVFPTNSHFHGSETGLTDYKPPWPLLVPLLELHHVHVLPHQMNPDSEWLNSCKILWSCFRLANSTAETAWNPSIVKPCEAKM